MTATFIPRLLKCKLTTVNMTAESGKKPRLAVFTVVMLTGTGVSATNAPPQTPVSCQDTHFSAAFICDVLSTLALDQGQALKVIPAAPFPGVAGGD